MTPLPNQFDGAVVLDATDRPFKAVGGALTVYPTLARADDVAAGYNAGPSMGNLSPLKAAECKVTYEQPGKAKVKS